jgi:pentose-5-phosphate-3-epimerase
MEKTKYENRVHKALNMIHSKIIKYDTKSGVSFKPLKESNKIKDAMDKMDTEML